MRNPLRKLKVLSSGNHVFGYKGQNGKWILVPGCKTELSVKEAMAIDEKDYSNEYFGK